MNDQLLRDVQRDAATWLAEGPERAPVELLARLLERSRATRQRPMWLALVLGAPAAVGGGAGRAVALRPLLIALALLLVAAMMVAVIGSRNDRPVTVLASPNPTPLHATQSASAEPTRSPIARSPTPTATATFDASQVPEVYTVADWGITLHRQSTTPWQAIEEGFDGSRIGIDMVGDPTRYVFMSVGDQTSRDLFFGSCTTEGCRRPLITLSLGRNGAGLVVGTTGCEHAPPTFYFDCLASNDLWPVTVSGSTLAQLRQDWLTTIGDATVTEIRLGGEPAIALEKGGRRTVLAIHGEVFVGLITQPLAGSSEEDAARALESVIRNFRFDDPPAASPTSPR